MIAIALLVVPSSVPGEAYAIIELSGDQAGAMPRASRRCPDPSGFMSQISASSLRSWR
jgi:hypothetical protein